MRTIHTTYLHYLFSIFLNHQRFNFELTNSDANGRSHCCWSACRLYSSCIKVKSVPKWVKLCMAFINTYWLLHFISLHTYLYIILNSSTFIIVSSNKPTSYYNQYYNIVLNIRDNKHHVQNSQCRLHTYDLVSTTLRHHLRLRMLLH